MQKSLIARRGYQLMSLASLATFAVCATWFYGVARLLMAADHPPASDSIELFGAHVNGARMLMRDGNVWSALLVLIPVLIATTWPWLSLRRLGAALYRCPPVSASVAKRLQHLGYALSGSATLTLLVAPLLSSALSHGAVLTVGLSPTFFIQAVAATCAFTMALIMREAVRLAEENQSFV